MFTPVIIGDILFFVVGVAIGHYGPKAVYAWFSKEAKKLRAKKKK